MRHRADLRPIPDVITLSGGVESTDHAWYPQRRSDSTDPLQVVNIQDKHLEGIPPDQRRLIFEARAHTHVLSGKRVIAMEAGPCRLCPAFHALVWHHTVGSADGSEGVRDEWGCGVRKQSEGACE